MNTKKKILYIIACLIIVVGIIVWKNNGFNLELQYSTRDQININNNTAINIDEIKEIASEVLGDTRYFVQEVETFGNSVSIVADEITDEQKAQIVDKVNEKYELDLDADNIETVSIPFARVKDVIKPFIIPGIITAVIILVYFLIRFRILDWKKIFCKTIIIPIMAELLLYSVIAICRIPFGRIAIACGIALYVIIIAIITYNFENQRENKIAEKQNEQTERN